jgi:hypothetical protein
METAVRLNVNFPAIEQRISNYKNTFRDGHARSTLLEAQLIQLLNDADDVINNRFKGENITYQLA